MVKIDTRDNLGILNSKMIFLKKHLGILKKTQLFFAIHPDHIYQMWQNFKSNTILYAEFRNVTLEYLSKHLGGKGTKKAISVFSLFVNTGFGTFSYFLT